MELRIFTEPQQGATYDDLLRVALAAESCGYGAFFRSDHYLAMNAEGLPGPTDAWITLAGLARETSTIRLGTLVTSATFRYPGPLAISVAQVDSMSGGRVELGLGAGWFEAEHKAYGIPFPPLGERFDKLEESLAVITGLWETPLGEKFSYDGQHFPISDSPALPKPMQSPRPPIVIGGMGKKKTPALTARYADEFNIPFNSVEASAEQFDRVKTACEAVGRTDIILSNALALCCGKTEADVERRAAVLGREVGELRQNCAAGSPAELVDIIGRYGEIGASRMYLQVMDLTDLDQIELVASEVMPQLGTLS